MPGRKIADVYMGGNFVSSEIVPIEVIENRIFIIRGKKVMLDRDLAKLYGVETAALNQALKRNAERFPEDFVFSLTHQEKVNISQIVICSEKPYETIKHSKHINVFTEHGILMLSSVLKSKRAVLVNIQIMRVFVNLRNMLSTHKELARKIDQLESKVGQLDAEVKQIFNAIKELMSPLPENTKKIGFMGQGSS